MQYFRPTDIGDALTWLKENIDAGAIVAAGCTDLFPSTSAPRLTKPVLDITELSDLRGIREVDAGWRIGAATTWTDVINSPLPAAFDALKLAAREVGSIQIQNVATVGGNLCNASPAADGVPCWLTLEADVELQSTSGTRTLPLASFLTGPRQTQLGPDEIMTAILVPRQSATGNSTFMKLGARKYLVISIAMVAGRLVGSDGKIEQLALSIGSCSAVAARIRDVETRLIGQNLDENVADLVTDAVVAPAISPIDDVRGAATYRYAAASHLVRQAVKALIRAAR